MGKNKIIPLDSSHKQKKKDFDCGEASLNEYLKVRANQDSKKNVSKCHVLVNEDNDILGYYTLSCASEKRSRLPESWQKKMPYDEAPVVLLGRLAIRNDLHGLGHGTTLLVHAFWRSYRISQEIGAMAVVVDPLDEKAAAYYERFGFIHLTDSERMFLPMQVIKKEFSEAMSPKEKTDITSHK